MGLVLYFPWLRNNYHGQRVMGSIKVIHCFSIGVHRSVSHKIKMTIYVAIGRVGWEIVGVITGYD